MERDVVAVVVTRNRIRLLKECIYSIEHQSIKPEKIVIVDNCSTDGTREYLGMLMKESPSIICIFNNSNVGGAGGFFQGIKEAILTYGDDVWVMDDDAIPRRNTLEELLKIRDLFGKEYGFVSSYVEWIDGTQCKMNRPLLKRGFNVKNYANVYELRQATFVSMLISYDAVLKVGLPIKEFFIWGDDQEFSRRISNVYHCYLAMDSVITHKMKVNSSPNLLSDDEDRLYRYFYKYRNEFYIARNKGPISIVTYILRTSRDFLLTLIFAKKQKRERIKTLIDGVCRGCTFKPVIERINEECRNEVDYNHLMGS